MTVKRMSRYSVEGFAPFPYDMLRYDESWPATESDAGAMERVEGGLRQSEALGPTRIRLATFSGQPTVERWQSFGWTVVDGTYTVGY